MHRFIGNHIIMGWHEDEQARKAADNGWGPPSSHDANAYSEYWRVKTANDFIKNTTWTPSEHNSTPSYGNYQPPAPYVELTAEQRAELARKRVEEDRVNAEKRREWYRTFFRRTGMVTSLTLAVIILCTSLFGLAVWASHAAEILKVKPQNIWVAPTIVALGVIISIVLFRTYAKLTKQKV